MDFLATTQITDQNLVLIASNLNSLKVARVKGHFTHSTTDVKYFLPLPSELHPILFQTNSVNSEGCFALLSFQRSKGTVSVLGTSPKTIHLFSKRV